MRAQAKRISREEEEESAFVSMTDMTVGFLFIMMLLLAFFASQIRDTDAVPRELYETLEQERDELRIQVETHAETIIQLKADMTRLRQERDLLIQERDYLVLQLTDARQAVNDLMVRIQELEAILAKLFEDIAKKDAEIERLNAMILEKDIELERLNALVKSLQTKNPLEDYLARVAQVRRDVLRRLRDALRADFPDLQVELSEESDALRFQGEGLFNSGQSTLTGQKAAIVAQLAMRLDEVLPCFTIGEASTFSEACNPGFVMIEAVQIEGHTDNVGSDRDNRTLSTTRANNTFFTMTGAAPDIMRHHNLKSQPVLSVAAYGMDRPVTENDTLEGRATNRRIDLRFIMVTPQNTDGIEAIRDALRSLAGDAR